jgi:hypothetical protein
MDQYNAKYVCCDIATLTFSKSRCFYDERFPPMFRPHRPGKYWSKYSSAVLTIYSGLSN